MLYELCWHLGASQGDIADLKGEDVDWENSTVSFVEENIESAYAGTSGSWRH